MDKSFLMFEPIFILKKLKESKNSLNERVTKELSKLEQNLSQINYDKK